MESGSPRLRLSVMMFGQYFILGAWAVTMSTYLMASPSTGGLHFPPSYTGWIYSTFAIAGIFSPLVTGFLADRLFSAQKLLGVFHLLAGILFFAVAATGQGVSRGDDSTGQPGDNPGIGQYGRYPRRSGPGQLRGHSRVPRRAGFNQRHLASGTV